MNELILGDICKKSAGNQPAFCEEKGLRFQCNGASTTCRIMGSSTVVDQFFQVVKSGGTAVRKRGTGVEEDQKYGGFFNEKAGSSKKHGRFEKGNLLDVYA